METENKETKVQETVSKAKKVTNDVLSSVKANIGAELYKWLIIAVICLIAGVGIFFFVKSIIAVLVALSVIGGGSRMIM